MDGRTTNQFAEQIERIFHDIELFIEASGREQANRMAGYIPKTLEEYLDTRQFSSAVYPCLLTLELVGLIPLFDLMFLKTSSFKC